MLVLAFSCAPALCYAETNGSGFREALTRVALGISDHAWGPLVAILGYALGGVLFAPANLLGAVTLAVFGLWPGLAIGWLGGLLAAMLSLNLGERLGTRGLKWIPERTRQRLLGLARRRAFPAVVLMRILPVGNFGVANLLAGAFKFPRRAYALGNMLGILLELLGLGLIGNRLSAALARPGVVNLLLLALALALVVGGIVILRRRYRTVLEAPRE